MSSTADIEELAAAWQIRRERPDWSERDQAELDAWLAEATANKVAWLRMEYGWRRVERLSALRSPRKASALAPVRLPRPTIHPRRFRYAAIAAGIALAVFAGVTLRGGGRTYATDLGGHQTVPLADGSKLELNTSTHVRTAVDAKQRVVWLDKGEAYFEVAHDGRPFVVYAGSRRVTVLGTKFSVRRDGDKVLVAVIEGRVRVEPVKPIKAAPPTVITRGDTVIAEADSTLLAPKSVEKVESELAWRHGLLIFDKTTLAEAADEMNRYNRKKLVVDDPAVASVRISGSFDADSVDAFARLLRQGFGLKIDDQGDEIKISS